MKPFRFKIYSRINAYGVCNVFFYNGDVLGVHSEVGNEWKMYYPLTNPSDSKHQFTFRPHAFFMHYYAPKTLNFKP
jgi:hypothetical protein